MADEVNTNATQGNAGQGAQDQNYHDQVKKIADMVWKLWKEDARRERERLGKRR